MGFGVLLVGKTVKQLPGIKSNIVLAPYTTFKIGGPAKYFFVAKNKEQLIEVIKWAQEKEVPFFVLGGGSNALVSDEGFDGLAIKVQNSKFQIQDSRIYAGAGVLLAKLVIESVKAGLTGLEWAAGIPGTIGGAICGNAGAFDHYISETVVNVEVLEINNNLTIKQFNNKECRFSYRDSIFKHEPLIILSAILKLNEGNREKSQKIIRQYLKKRKQEVPGQPSAGCVFKNILIERLGLAIKKIIPSEKIKGGKISSGYLVDQCGLKGRQIGQAKISEKHANFIINLGKAKARDVIALIKLCKSKVGNKFGIELEEEIKYIGF